MNGYQNAKEQQTASNVRRLIEEGRKFKFQLYTDRRGGNLTPKEIERLENEIQNLQEEADKLSLQLVTYLKINHPQNFKVNIAILTDEEVYYFNEVKTLNKEERKILYKINKNYGKKITNHDFLFLDHPQIEYVFFLFNDNGWISGSIIMKKGGDNTIKFPDFLNFMEVMGLTLKAANLLYDFSILSTLPYHPKPNTIIISATSFWPNKITTSKKLI